MIIIGFRLSWSSDPSYSRRHGRSSWLNQSLTRGVADELGRVVNAKSGSDPGPVRVSWCRAHPEQFRHLLRRLPRGRELESLALPRRQAIG